MTESAPTRRLVRCAIYTRKSTEEGLQQEFNSLDAQRESAEAYIISMKQEGWVCLPARYDDGGFTGGNMDRPALKRLMEDIAAGRVDAVVVYKVDRLSRSLLDFARLMALFEQHRVAFVSTTQQFSTATSMGRLVLNVLLSFAQFEREIISERTRDKIAATRKKGKWPGGFPVLGYRADPATSKLVIDTREAVRVRAIFNLYLELRSLLPVVRELKRRGWFTKRWTTKAGKLHEGKPFDRISLHRLLTRVLYTGHVPHKGQQYPGEHRAIVDADTFSEVQELLLSNRRATAPRARDQYRALLLGILRCGPCQRSMTPTYACAKQGKRYRYYHCTKAQQRGRETCASHAVSAASIEEFVMRQVRQAAGDPAFVTQVLGDGQPGASGLTRETVANALAVFGPQWDSLSSAAQARLVQLIVERVEYDGSLGKLWITFSQSGMRTFVLEQVREQEECA